MFVFNPVKQAKSIAFTFARIKHNDFIAIAFVILLIVGQQLARSQIRVHTTYTVHEDIWSKFIILNGYMPNNPFVQILIKFR